MNEVTALERRQAISAGCTTEHGRPRSEIARRLTEDALHDRGLTLRQLQDAGVSHAAVMKVLRTSE